MVESSALLKRRSPKGYRGFESLPHRQLPVPLLETSSVFCFIVRVLAAKSHRIQAFLARRSPGTYFRSVKLVLAVLLAAGPFYLDGCAEIPDTDDVHEQQLQRSYAAPGQPIKPPDEPDGSSPQPVPGE